MVRLSFGSFAGPKVAAASHFRVWQTRKSAEVAGMSAPGGRADIDFRRLEVRL